MSCRPLFLGLIACLITGTAGCMKTRLTDPKRAAAEQLLLSTAADRAWVEADLAPLSGRKVFVRPEFLETYDQKYVMGTIRAVLSESGALLMDNIKEADVVVEPRSGALSIDSGSTLGGVPSIPLPIPTVATLETPEVAFFKSEKQKAIGKFALLAYERESRQHVTSSSNLVGTAYRNHYQILGFIKLLRSDIPVYKWKQKSDEAD